MYPLAIHTTEAVAPAPTHRTLPTLSPVLAICCPCSCCYTVTWHWLKSPGHADLTITESIKLLLSAVFFIDAFTCPALLGDTSDGCLGQHLFHLQLCSLNGTNWYQEVWYADQILP